MYRLLDAVDRLSPEQFTQNLGNSFPSIRDTLVHLCGAEQIWCARWEGQPPRSMPDPAGFPDVASIRRAWVEQERQIRAVLERFGENGVDQAVEYRMLSGQSQAQPFWQMLQHLANHGSYHRGQVTTMLRQLQQKPAARDLTFGLCGPERELRTRCDSAQRSSRAERGPERS